MPTLSSLTLCALGLAAGLPSLAHAAPDAATETNAAIVTAAKTSPLFKKEVSRSISPS